jgi:site-specific DNA-methyltransferase (adenine-specific)
MRCKPMDKVKLFHGDCLELMKDIPDKSVDLILTDPPYGTTACKWDSVIPFEPMWKQLGRVIKINSAIVLFGNGPFTSALIMSNPKWFKYRWDWDKKIPSGMGYAKYRPMQQSEDVVVFSYNGAKTRYHPQMTKRDSPIKSGGNSVQAGAYNEFKCMAEGNDYKKTYDEKFPTTMIQFLKIRKGAVHPTQKPVDLLEYLIKTYTNEGDTVLDFTMGSGSTGVACVNTNRNFIGIELDDKYFEIAKRRISEALEQKGEKNEKSDFGIP